MEDKSRIETINLWIEKIKTLVRFLLRRLFDEPVKLEKSKLLVKYGIHEEDYENHIFIQKQLENFRFKLFSVYCVLVFIFIFLFSSLFIFWIPSLFSKGL